MQDFWKIDVRIPYESALWRQKLLDLGSRFRCQMGEKRTEQGMEDKILTLK
jgi:hypothetical protein